MNKLLLLIIICLLIFWPPKHSNAQISTNTVGIVGENVVYIDQKTYLLGKVFESMNFNTAEIFLDPEYAKKIGNHARNIVDSALRNK